MKQQGALSRGQRKRAKNAQRVRNRMNFASVIGKKHNDEGVNVLGNVTALAGALEDVSASQLKGMKRAAAKPKKLTKKTKAMVMAAEMQQFQNVLQHQGFQSNPLSTIHHHLETTVKIRNQVNQDTNRSRVAAAHE